MTFSRGAAVALVAVLASGLSACGEDSPTPPPTTASSSTSGATASTTPDPKPQAKKPVVTAPAPATTAEELARRVVAAEDTIRRAGATEPQLLQAAFETQVLYRQLARETAWQRQVLPAVGSYRAIVADHLEARRSLRSVLTRLSDELPAWRIVPPAPATSLEKFYREGERVHGVPWEVLAAVNFVETGFGKIRGYSTAGARGPMQFIPATWAAYGKGDIDDPRDSILAAARYLAANGGGTPAGLDGALHAYNHHDGYVRGIRAYARVLERDPDALAGLYRWQIVYLSTRGDLWLPRGYSRPTPLPVDTYLARHPKRQLSTATN